jgi:DNA-nicking Smr family endonuclease
VSKGRKPRSDELDLWKKVTQSTTRIVSDHANPSAPAPDISEPQAEPTVEQEFLNALPPRLGGGKSWNGHDLSKPLADQISGAPVQMDKKRFGQMTRGKLKPEARLDLHGMTMDRAHPALVRFILGAHAADKRLVLVITGKGKDRDEGGPIPVRTGVLRHQVPQWLTLHPLSPLILQVTQAHLKHGGEGAYYVYLKRKR